MNNLEKYTSCFIDGLSADQDHVNDKLEYNSISEWDSIGHMTLISELEDKFSISIDTDDIIDFSSYKKGKDILKKYKVSL